MSRGNLIFWGIFCLNLVGIGFGVAGHWPSWTINLAAASVMAGFRWGYMSAMDDALGILVSRLKGQYWLGLKYAQKESQGERETAQATPVLR
jgi:hypothetical protein